MERVYITMTTTPPYCKFGNKLQFNTYEKGYRKGCILGNRCKCVSELRMTNQSATLKSKYGVTKVSQIPDIVDKRKATNLKKYGVEWSQQLDSYRKAASSRIKTPEQMAQAKNKTTQTNLKKYGVAHHMQLLEQQQKVKNTNVQRYGTEFPLQNNNIASKMKLTISNRTDEEKEQIEKYRRDQYFNKYGVNAASQIALSSTAFDVLTNRDRFVEYITDKTRLEVATELDIAMHTLYLYAKKYDVAHLFATPSASQFELAVKEHIQSLTKYIVLSNIRTVIPPKELDIYIPELKLAVECCGLYWHSEISAGRDRNYHLEKYRACRELGITLITVFEDEWSDKNIQVKNRLANIVTADVQRIAARKCQVVELDKDTCSAFVNTYHLQGSTASAIRLGLMHDKKLVSVMTFARARYSNIAEWEIIRFCSSVPVTGAAGKLFAHFIDNYNPDSVVSYNDNRWGSGRVYEKIGFRYVDSNAGFFYTDYKRRFNRLQFQKHKLVENGADPALTEWQIMQQQGYDRIWDCGQSQWIWNKLNTNKVSRQ